MYKEFADLFNYKNLNGAECNLIEEEVDIVAEQYEEYKQKQLAEKDNKIDFKQFFLIKTDVCMY